MSKEMTPKEALDELCDLATPNGDCLNYVIGLSGIILKALDRLELLEKENKEQQEKISKFEKPILYMCLTRQSRELERLRLLELVNTYNVPILLNDFETVKELEKLKKVIAWLKNTFEITLDSKVRISDGTDCIQAFPIDLKTNEVLYDLLKEMLENV